MNWLIYFIISALGESCLIFRGGDDCTFLDPNSECDTGNTFTCICSANYVEEPRVCKSEYIGTAY